VETKVHLILAGSALIGILGELFFKRDITLFGLVQQWRFLALGTQYEEFLRSRIFPTLIVLGLSVLQHVSHGRVLETSRPCAPYWC
jgi:hypothetical protein